MFDESINRFKQFWNDRGLEFLFAISIIIIIVLCFYNYLTGQQGTYTHQPNFSTALGGMMFPDPPKDPYFNYRQHTVRDSKLELASKYHLEQLFQRPFYKIRPDFLKNEATGRNLELDLYNHELRLAVEVQGKQHYEYTPRFHMDASQLEGQHHRDQLKKKRCQQFGIRLIEVPYNIKEKNLRDYLLMKLRAAGISPRAAI